MKIVIEQRHTLNTTYDNCDKCALHNAIMEQCVVDTKKHRLGVGGNYVSYGHVDYPFNSEWWNYTDFDKLRDGIIDKVEIEINLPFEKRVTEQPKIKEVIRYVTVSDTLKEQARELITQQ